MTGSKLITWRHHRRSPKAKKALFPKVLVSDLKAVPIPKLDPKNPKHVAQHDRLVQLVQQIIDLAKLKVSAHTSHEQVSVQRQISAIDNEIDRHVYGLYGLTESEQTIVDAAVSQDSDSSKQGISGHEKQ